MSELKNGDSTQLMEKLFQANSFIFDEGDIGDAAYIIRSGEVEIRKGVSSNNPLRLAVLSKGDVLGEMALFDDRPRMASAIALTNVEVIKMSKQDFLDKLSVLDPAMKGMVMSMVARVRSMADEFMRRKGQINWEKFENPE